MIIIMMKVLMSNNDNKYFSRKVLLFEEPDWFQ